MKYAKIWKKFRDVGMCPGNLECRVFSAAMKIVVAKNHENTVWQSF
jgi:hypothetical protein